MDNNVVFNTVVRPTNALPAVEIETMRREFAQLLIECAACVFPKSTNYRTTNHDFIDAVAAIIDENSYKMY